MILAGLIKRNPSWATKNTRQLNKVRRSMKAYKSANPACEVTGLTRRTEVHHVRPLSIAPELAADWSNFMTLHRDVHRGLAHPGRSENFLVNIRQIVALLRIQRTSDGGR